jgi:tripartite-type tricarboxylate transporter receptor subunit TctC
MVVTSEAGGGYDLYGRLIARHIGNHLPGQPRVVVQNMPGAGGIVGANYLFNLAPRDGTVIGVVPEILAISQLIDNASSKYDARQFLWLGRVNSNVGVQHTWKSSGIATIADAKRREVVVAGVGPASYSVIFPRLLNALLGTKFKIVPGYAGASAATLAFERGEVDGVDTPWSVIKATKGEWLRDNRINILVQYCVGRHPDLPDVPAVVDLAETQEQHQILGLYASACAIGRSVAAPPGLPADTATTLRAAFTATIRDPALLAETQKAGIELNPLSGADLQQLVANTFDIPPSVIEKVKGLLEVK